MKIILNNLFTAVCIFIAGSSWIATVLYGIAFLFNWLVYDDLKYLGWLFIAGSLTGISLAMVGFFERRKSELEWRKFFEDIKNAPIENIHWTGELRGMFEFGSDSYDKYTLLQRDIKLNELRGKCIQWSMPIVTVSQSELHGYYFVQTVGADVKIYASGDAEKRFLEGLKPGNTIRFKGYIKERSYDFKGFMIDPSILV